MKDDTDYIPVTYESCDHLVGPFYHGTKSVCEIGEELVAGFESNFHSGRVFNNIYFSSILETAIWGAELAVSLSQSEPLGESESLSESESFSEGERLGRIYVVEPLGPFEDDPNVTNKRFPGNPTESYRTRYPLRVVGEVEHWEGHPPEVLQGMLDHLAKLRSQGLDVIED